MHGDYATWYAEDGIHLHKGRSITRYESNSQFISWESVAEHIGELLEEGSFATNVELTEVIAGIIENETELHISGNYETKYKNRLPLVICC